MPRPSALRPTPHALPPGAVAAVPPLPVSFSVVLALFTVLAVARVADLVTALDGLPIGKLLGLAMIVLAFMYFPRAEVSAAFRTRPLRAMLVVAALAVLSIPTSVYRSDSVRFVQGFIVPGLVFFFIASIAYADRRAARTSLAFMLAAVAAGAVRMFVDPLLDREGRARFGSLDANDTAVLLVISIPFALMFASEKGASRRLLYVLPLLLVGALVRTGSRGGLLGLVAVGVWLMFLATPRRRITYLVGVVAGIFTFALTAEGQLQERFTTIFSVEEDYNLSDRDGRIEVWKRGLGYMITRPVFGVGVGGFEVADGTLSGKQNEGHGIRYTAAHNAFVQVGAELGVGGLIAFVTAVTSAGLGCWRVRQRAVAERARAPAVADDEAAMAGTALTSLIGLVVSVFFLSFAYHPITYFTIAMCAGVARGSTFLRAPAAGDAAGAVTAAPPMVAMSGWRSAGSRRYARG